MSIKTCVTGNNFILHKALHTDGSCRSIIVMATDSCRKWPSDAVDCHVTSLGMQYSVTTTSEYYSTEILNSLLHQSGHCLTYRPFTAGYLPPRGHENETGHGAYSRQVAPLLYEVRQRSKQHDTNGPESNAAAEGSPLAPDKLQRHHKVDDHGPWWR